MKISCILITKKSEYPKKVLDRLNTGFFDEILIKTESPSVYERYLLAKQAKNYTIYFQDDDCFTNYQELYKYYDSRLTNGITENHKAYYDPLDATLVGWGCFITKPMLDVFEKYIAKYGEDAHLLREADRIFTYFNRPFNSIIMHHEDLPQEPDRMSFEENHYKSAHEAIDKCKQIDV